MHFLVVAAAQYSRYQLLLQPWPQLLILLEDSEQVADGLWLLHPKHMNVTRVPVHEHEAPGAAKAHIVQRTHSQRMYVIIHHGLCSYQRCHGLITSKTFY